ncbi:unnamed protein product, partial [Rhizophagus irregularis]
LNPNNSKYIYTSDITRYDTNSKKG